MEIQRIECTGGLVEHGSVPGARFATGAATDGCIQLDDGGPVLRLSGRIIAGSKDAGMVNGVGELVLTPDRLIVYGIEGVWNEEAFSDSRLKSAVAVSANLGDLTAITVQMKKKAFGGRVGKAIMFEFGEDCTVGAFTLDRIEHGRPSTVKDTRPLAEQIAISVAERRGLEVPRWADTEDGLSTAF
jgi:hypothetical protein